MRRMTSEQQFFLGVISDFIHKKNSMVPDGLDWDTIMQYARNHAVEGIVWHQCQSYLKSKNELQQICNKLSINSVNQAFHYANNLYAYSELEHAFQANHIHYVSVKGLSVAKFFPVPAYRTMGDMDIIVADDDYGRIQDIMLQLGYRRRPGELVQCYRRDKINFEIHKRLVNEQNMETVMRRVFFNRIWDYVSEENGIYTLDWNFHFLFLVEHTKQHFSANGAGFRQFMDIAVVAMKEKDLNWNWIKRELVKISLWDFTITAFAFCKRWWSCEFPFDIPDLDEDFYIDSTEFVFKNGVFGFNNENSNIHAIEKQMRISLLPRTFRILAVAIKKVCISYHTAQTLPYCEFVKGRRYLLPIAWIYRVFYVAIHKRGNISNALGVFIGSNRIIDAHKNLMDRWGV